MEKFEADALEYASKMGGEFIEYLGKTDMALYSREEWMQLVECIGMNFCNKRAELEKKAWEPPY